MVVISRVALELVLTAMSLSGSGGSGLLKFEAGDASAGRHVVPGFQPHGGVAAR